MNQRTGRPDRRDRLERLAAGVRLELRSWTDAPGHDPGIALLELFAFLGETLSSYADAIGDESYLASRIGVAGLEVTIDGDRWQPVPALVGSGPDDAHYIVTAGKDGATVVEFGDGVHGRRPPSGAEIRVRYRSGRRYTSVTLQQGRVVIDADWSEAASSS